MAENLRVALIAGTLGQAGAEKQLFYLARGLKKHGVNVRVYCLTQGEYYESRLKVQGIEVIWIGQRNSRIFRAAELIRVLLAFQPHIVQAAHFYTNLYSAASGRTLGCLSLGTLRADAFNEVSANGRWGKLHLKTPHGLLANSFTARRNTLDLGVRPASIYVLPNGIDLDEFDRQAGTMRREEGKLTAVIATRLIERKRVDLFLEALARVKGDIPRLHGIVAGDGPKKAELESRATALGLTEDDLSFMGHVSNLADLFNRSDIFVLCSDFEGFPNVILEAMASRMPVVTTPSGDSARVVVDGVSGFVVPFDDSAAIAGRMLELSRDSNLRRAMGEAGRRLVQQYDADEIAGQWLQICGEIAERRADQRLIATLGESAAHA